MFNDKYDELFGTPTPKTEVVHSPQFETMSANDIAASTVQDEEFEPERALDPEVVPEEPDPFALLLDEVLAAEGVDVKLEKRRKYDPTKGNVQEHDWQAAKDTIYSDESYKFRCKRCLKWLVVKREETMGEVMGRDGVDPNCASAVISSVMNDEEEEKC